MFREVSSYRKSPLNANDAEGDSKDDYASF